MERLDFTEGTKYSPIEASIHLNRYLIAKPYVCGKRVLDVACGEGYGSRLLKEWGAAEVIGLDISEEAVGTATRLFGCEGVHFYKHTVEQLPFEDDSFDLVVSFETVEHLDHPEQFLKEIARVVRFNGEVILSCPNDHIYAEQVTDFDNPYHKRRWTFFEFKEFAETYLGRNARWEFGFALNGYTNIPQEQCKLPETDKLPESMSEMMQSLEVGESLYVQPARYLNYWNASYYVGLWNCSTTNGQIGQAVIFPREFFVEPEDPNYEEIGKIYRIHHAQVMELQNQLENCRAENERTSDALKLAEKEKAELEEREGQLKHALHISQINAEEERAKLEEREAELEKCRVENESISDALKLAEEERAKLEEREAELQRTLHISEINNERTSNLLKIAEEEKARLWGRINNLQQDLERANNERAWLQSEYHAFQSVKNTKAYKLIRLWWRLGNRLKRVFGRK